MEGTAKSHQRRIRKPPNVIKEGPFLDEGLVDEGSEMIRRLRLGTVGRLEDEESRATATDSAN